MQRSASSIVSCLITIILCIVPHTLLQAQGEWQSIGPFDFSSSYQLSRLPHASSRSCPCALSIALPAVAHIMCSPKAALGSTPLFVVETPHKNLRELFALHIQRAQKALIASEKKHFTSLYDNQVIQDITAHTGSPDTLCLSQFSNECHYAHRITTAHSLNRSNTRAHHRTLSQAAQSFAQAHSIQASRYQDQYGNELQCILFDEAIIILESATQQAQNPHTRNYDWLYDSVATINDAGFDCTLMHAYDRAFACHDWCFALLNIGRQLLTGVKDGAYESTASTLHTLKHPLSACCTTIDLIRQAGWHTAQLLAHCTQIATIACTDPGAAAELAFDDYAYLKNAAELLYSKACELSVYDWSRFASIHIFDRAVTGKLLLGLSNYTRNAVSSVHHTHQHLTLIGVAHEGFGSFYRARRRYGSTKKKIKRWVNKHTSRAHEYVHAKKMCERFTEQLPQLHQKYGIALHASQDRLVHIAIGELEKWGISGCHTLFGLKAQSLKYIIRKVLPNGALKVDVLHPHIDLLIPKTLFPQKWGFHDIFDAMKTAKKNIIYREECNHGRIKIIGLASKNLKIEMIVESDGRLVTAYPSLT